MKRRQAVSERAGLGVALGALISFVIDGLLWPAVGLAIVLGATTPAYDIAYGLYAVYLGDPACEDDAVLAEVVDQLSAGDWAYSLPTGERIRPIPDELSIMGAHISTTSHRADWTIDAIRCEADFVGRDEVPLAVRYSVRMADRSTQTGRAADIEVTDLAHP